MVSSKRGFSHISVSADDEDDLVIEAGAPASCPEGGAGGAAWAGAGEAGGEAPAPEPAAAQRDDAADGGGAADDDGAAGAAEPEAEPAPRPARKADDAAYRTSLEDLQNSKMGGVQKAVIVVAAIALVAFAVYYLFFM